MTDTLPAPIEAPAIRTMSRAELAAEVQQLRDLRANVLNLHAPVLVFRGHAVFPTSQTPPTEPKAAAIICRHCSAEEAIDDARHGAVSSASEPWPCPTALVAMSTDDQPAVAP